MPESREIHVTHEPAASRFVAHLDAGDAVVEYQRDGREVHFTHTEVPPAHEGQGVGSRGAKAALDGAVGEGLGIVPQCPFIRAYVKRHPEYGKHVPAEWRSLVER